MPTAVLLRPATGRIRFELKKTCGECINRLPGISDRVDVAAYRDGRATVSELTRNDMHGHARLGEIDGMTVPEVDPVHLVDGRRRQPAGEHTNSGSSGWPVSDTFGGLRNPTSRLPRLIKPGGRFDDGIPALLAQTACRRRRLELSQM